MRATVRESGVRSSSRMATGMSRATPCSNSAAKKRNETIGSTTISVKYIGWRRMRVISRQREAHVLWKNPGIAFRPAYSIRLQSTSTLMPGRMYSTQVTGLALTVKVRMSKPPCVRVAAQVAKSACGAM